MFGAILGSVIATVAVVLPSLVIIVIVTIIFEKFKSSKYVQGALRGIKPVVVGLILSAVLTVGCKVVLPNLNFKNITAESFSQFNWISLIIIAAVFPLSKLKIKKRRFIQFFLFFFRLQWA